MADIIDDTKTFTIALTAAAAKGSIVSINAPASAGLGERASISALIKNIGGSVGDFKIQVNAEASMQVRLSPGSSYTLSVYALMPTAGTSVTLTLKCIRIT